ncbi:uncharacterized protein LOC130052780 isoform X4 [Ostrea edulis]|uniref:uncharacterized protein LOC130052780 isoform X4 n=1 Tax=Ostrea edulis TaxID=37623 RepID=UPI0024AFF8CB|nr:uncharacterized protein LOC130052780 isoform X4 [Ostrea edulis]
MKLENCAYRFQDTPNRTNVISSTFSYFLYILSIIYRMVFDFCCFCVRPCSSRLPEDITENGHLLAHSINVSAPLYPEMCKSILDSFSQTYLSSTRESLNWDTSNMVNRKTIVMCANISRIKDDIKATLNRLHIKGKPKIMLVLIHACEPDVTPENLLTDLGDKSVTSFTNIFYSESMDACYKCSQNREAAKNINKFIG